MIFDSSVKNVISAAYQNEKDVFLKVGFSELKELSFDEVKTVVFMPGSFYSDESTLFSDVKVTPLNFELLASPSILFADIRFLANEDFRKYLTENSYRRFAVIFAECADKAEYGYREAYGWIGEYKAEISHFCQIVAFFTSSSDSLDYCMKTFSCKDVVFIGEQTELEMNSFEAVSPKAKFYAAASSAEKYAYRRVCVYFNSRGEATEFRDFLQNRGTAFVYSDGSVPFREQKKGILDFSISEPNILIATKAYIPTSLFYKPEKIIFCGVPFSRSHLYRCSPLSGMASPTVIYCEDDIKRNERIISSFSRNLDDEEIMTKRLSRLCDMKNMLKDYQ